MAKAVLNSGIAILRGAIDGWVYKYYRDARGVVVSRRPDMSGVKPSAKQKAQRKRMGEASRLLKQVKGDPVLLKKFQAIARRKRINLQAAVAGEVLRKADTRSR